MKPDEMGQRRPGDRRGMAEHRPVRSSFLPFGVPCLGDEEIAEVVDTLRSTWIGMGPKVRRFEEELAAYVGAQHAVAVSSCTAALFLSLVALEIGPGHEVIITPLTFAATVNVIEHVGARPVFVDVDPGTLNLNPELVQRAITQRTRAILPVHFGGLACDMDALQAIAERAGLVILEDAAHALGTRYKGKMVGSIAHATSFSFYANKNLTTAEGGMIMTPDPALAEKLRTLRLHGLSTDAWRRFGDPCFANYEVLMLGYKCNMTDLAASLGIHQLRKQERFLEIRERYARIYDRAFADLPVRFQHRPAGGQDDRHSLHLYVLILEDGRWRVGRDRVIAALLRENIGAALHYRAVHTHRYYRDKYGYQPEDYPSAYTIGERIFSLPMTPGMSEMDVEDVVTAVRKVAELYAK